jgi:ribonucleoside-diphosphate reductase alpha chain
LDDDGTPLLGPRALREAGHHRLAGSWRWWGEQRRLLRIADDDAQAFEDELAYMLVHQMAAPNSPQWFNTGLNHMGLRHHRTGPGLLVRRPLRALMQSTDSYSRPTPHACFIQSVDDDLVGEGGIMDLWTREARLFKYGSGTGTNFSRMRAEGEPLSGGGKSSGLMSFLKVGDRAAGAIKSGGTTRRAAKMVCSTSTTPTSSTFINWKAEEEKKVRR